MFYFPGISSSFQEDKYKNIVKTKLKSLKEDVDCLVHWNHTNIDESNQDNKKYKKEYLELQRIINEIIK